MVADFDDSLDDLLGGPMAPESHRPIVTPPATYKPQHIEPCKKCNGRGRFISYAGRDVGPCFHCKGVGKKTFAASADVRAANREKAATRKADRLAADAAAFRAREPEIAAWLDSELARPQPFAFAVAMQEALAKYGDLTERQTESCRKLAHKAAARKAERAVRDAAAPEAVGADKLKAAFDHAVAYAKARGYAGMRRLKLTIHGNTISPAPAHGKNPGALYVKDANEAYLGKIAGGRFYATAACSAEMTEQVLAFIADPAAAAKAYGQKYKWCCVCNAMLTNEESMARGMGPICAEKFGW